MSILDSILSDTVGVVYRASTGKVDPWTQAEINDETAKGAVTASNGSITYEQALQQAESDANYIEANQMSWSDAAKAWTSNVFSDDGSGCSLITNPAGCYPSWLPYVFIAGGVLFVLWVLRPYIGLAEEA